MPWTAPHGQTAATRHQVSIGVTTSIGQRGGSDIVDHTTCKRRFDTLVATLK
ncbi:TPA: hypothetical protein N0F65_005859 [Lagenidium giganteum]|uniref:Uncharacterized protein n=1 Tax=Lagenidium giganteum TaxID=4803 RepID=A0AAV2YRL9_9STRA|nr:TPA: hypothetical protein N0F65_005859 [Lagenidium giganteum]